MLIQKLYIAIPWIVIIYQVHGMIWYRLEDEPDNRLILRRPDIWVMLFFVFMALLALYIIFIAL